MASKQIIFSFPTGSKISLYSSSLGVHLTVHKPNQSCTLEVPTGSSLQYEGDEESDTYYIYEP